MRKKVPKRSDDTEEGLHIHSFHHLQLGKVYFPRTQIQVEIEICKLHAIPGQFNSQFPFVACPGPFFEMF